MNEQFDMLMTKLLQFAYDHGVGYTLTKKLDAYTPSVSEPETRQIIINMNWHNRLEIPFQVAHELGHVVNGDQGVLYYSPGNFKYKYERKASLMGLDIILPMYADCSDGNIPSNYVTVMDQLQIPKMLEGDVISRLNKLE